MKNKMKLAAVLISCLIIGLLPGKGLKTVAAPPHDLSTGSYGFFQSRGSKDAMEVIEWGANTEGSTVIGGEKDATNIDLMLASLDFIDECNELRAKHGLNALLVNDYMMAVAEVQLNWSDSNTAHSQFYNVGENLAWNYSDPFDGWYTKEKALYDAGERTYSKIGHYLNIVNPDYTVTGFAISKDNSGGWEISEGQTFQYSGAGQTVDSYRSDLQSYIESGKVKPEDVIETVPSSTPLDSTPVSMHRLYNPNSGEHFYTASEAERDKLRKAGWKYEGLGWTAPTKSNAPVWRLYNPNAGDHHYTMNYDEVVSLIYAGWNYEGIGWYSNPVQTTPLYREYNPNAASGSHNYTVNKEEHDHLVSLGWKGEGIGWYGL